MALLPGNQAIETLHGEHTLQPGNQVPVALLPGNQAIETLHGEHTLLPGNLVAVALDGKHVLMPGNQVPVALLPGNQAIVTLHGEHTLLPGNLVVVALDGKHVLIPGNQVVVAFHGKLPGNQAAVILHVDDMSSPPPPGHLHSWPPTLLAKPFRCANLDSCCTAGMDCIPLVDESLGGLASGMIRVIDRPFHLPQVWIPGCY